MRTCVGRVCWTLFLASVILSGPFFLIVASESTEASETPEAITGQEHDTPVKDVAGDTSDGDYEPSEPKLPEVHTEVHPRPTVKTEREHLHSEESDGKLPSHENSWERSKTESKVDVLKESLIQQPNLSQGISETGQAVVLTLVDTATAELQSLAEPKLSNEIRSRESEKNATLTTTTTTTRTLPLASTTTTTTTSTAPSSMTPQIPNDVEAPMIRQVEELHSSDSSTIPTIVEPSKNSSDADSTTEEIPTTTTTTIVSEKIRDDGHDDVVTVTAERKIYEEPSTTRPDDVSDDEARDDGSTRSEENLGPSPDADDGVGRVRIVGGSGDEGGTVIIDGLVATGSTDHHQHHHHQEDIPSFSEWAQKRLEEAEKKKTHPNASIQNPGSPNRGVGGMRVRSKNYASPDCGAKIVAVNPEARSARSVLVSTRDEYMLNTCTSRVWFVVELCEAIQAKKIELANFELFSSSPKDFTVHVSDRFPTRDWSPVGQFTAKDQRDVQSFALNPHLFGKFIKIEMQTHYGSEHFCPISLFRAYGTSEFEVLETETDHQDDETNENDDDDDDENDATNLENHPDSKNLFGSARDAVIRIVKKAAEVLVKTTDTNEKNNNSTNVRSIVDRTMTKNSFENCTSPRYVVDCNNCTDERYAGVVEILNCHAGRLNEFLKIPFIDETLRFTDICHFYGVENSKSSEINYSEKISVPEITTMNFVNAILSPDYIIAICNVISTKERKLSINGSREIVVDVSVDSSSKMDGNIVKFEVSETNGRATNAICATDVISGNCGNSAIVKDPKNVVATNRETETTIVDPTETTSTRSENLASQIKPTKTLSREDVKKESSVPILEPSKDPNDETVQMEVITTPSPIFNVPTATARIDDESSISGNSGDAILEISTTVVTPSTFGNREIADSSTKAHRDGENDGIPSITRPQTVDGDGKHGKPDIVEQEVKFSAQEQISLDSILSDLKDLESDAAGAAAAGIHGSGHNYNSGSQPTASNAPQQKESVFLRLSNRIKALERNMSLSGQYLEELSKLYKKQVEEMQRSLERSTAAMTEESRKGEERENRRVEEINNLRDEINGLTRSLEILLYDRDSWRGKLSTICQHFVLIVVEIVVLIIVVSYCRRGDNEFDDVGESTSVASDEATRRRSAGAMMSGSKKIRKRRPSEIASKISGTYGHLMIDDAREAKKERKKRKKRDGTARGLENGEEGDSRTEEAMPGGTNLSSRRSSSIVETSNHARQLELSHTRRRPDSAPEYSGSWGKTAETENNGGDGVEEVRETDANRSTNDGGPAERPGNEENRENDGAKNLGGTIFVTGGGILKAAKLSSPSFMKTALGSRNKRSAKTGSGKGDSGAQLRSDNWEWYAKNSGNKMEVDNARSDGSNGGGTTNGHRRNPSDESGSSSATTTPGNKKDKKSGGGLRKMAA